MHLMAKKEAMETKQKQICIENNKKKKERKKKSLTEDSNVI